MRGSVKLNAFYNGIRQCIRYLYGFFIIVYISRVLGSGNYGRYCFGNSVISYFTMIANFGIGTYAIREGAFLRKDRKSLSEFCSEMFSISFIFTLIAYAGLILLLKLPVFEQYKNIIFILSIPIFFQWLGVDWICEIHEDYLYGLIRYFIVHTAAFVIMVITVQNQDDLVAFLWVSILPGVLTNIINLFYLRKKYVNPKFCKVHAAKYIKTLFIIFCNAMAISVYVEIDKTFLTFIKGDSVTGIYSIAASIYTFVKTMINSMTSVLLPRLSSMQSGKEISDRNRLLSKAFHALLLVLLPCATGILFMAQPIILLTAGQDYSEGTVALRILSVAMIFGSVAYFYVYAIMLPGKQENKVLCSTLISAAVNVVLNLILIPGLSLNGAAITTLLSEAIVVVCCVNFSRQALPVKLSFKDIMPVLAGSFAIAVICLLSILVFGNSISGLIIAIAVSAAFYGIVLFIMRDAVFMSLVSTLYRKVNLKR